MAHTKSKKRREPEDVSNALAFLTLKVFQAALRKNFPSQPPHPQQHTEIIDIPYEDVTEQKEK